MKTFRQFYRLFYIFHVASKNSLDVVLLSIPLFKAFKFLSYLNPWNWFRKSHFSRAEAVRVSLEELGPIFIKFGQALSTRPDLFPEDVAQALSQLQDKVASFSSDQAVRKIERALGAPIAVLFAQFEMQPLASASIAQVHAATLHDGRSVVVKVLRPGIKKQIKEDLSLIKRIALMIERYWREIRRYRLVALVEEFEAHLIDELDLQREGANASQLRRNFLHSPLLYVPEILWEYSKNDVLVMERIHGIPISNRANLEAAGINIPKLAAVGVEIFFTQVFRDSFFHADMHPGNIFVSPYHPEDPSYVCVDFGLMGSLSEEDQRYLAYNLYAFFSRDYRRVAELHIESGWVARDIRVDEFESAIRTVCEPIFERPLHDISFAKLVLHLLLVAKRFKMEVQPQLMLLQKTLLAVEGLGRQLYPELDLWTTAKPSLERWLKSKFGPKVFLKELKAQLPFITEQLPHLPKLLYDVLALNKAHLEVMQLRLQSPKLALDKPSRLPRFLYLLLGVMVGTIASLIFHYYM